MKFFNKPTLKFKTEAFCYLICNAWELLLKAYLLHTDNSIFYIKSNGKTNRTLSIKDCVKKIFTNDKDPLRINLETIISLRNSSTHLVISEYAVLMSEYFISCVKNYTEKLNKFFNIDINDMFPSAYLTLQTGNIVKLEDLDKKIYQRHCQKIFGNKQTYE